MTPRSPSAGYVRTRTLTQWTSTAGSRPHPFRATTALPPPTLDAASPPRSASPDRPAICGPSPALCETRLLVPVVATATRLGETVGGLSSDKEAEMSLVMLQTPDGRRALLGFTGLDALQAWQIEARPVPVTLDLAARTAESEGVDAVLVDVAGPHPLAIDGEVLSALAAGRRLVETGPDEFGWAVSVPGSPPAEGPSPGASRE